MDKSQSARSEGNRRSRTYNVERTKAIILDAAEEAFAERGFDGARIDAIAEASGYNKSLIYQYFGDKLMLYTEVVKRADEVGGAAAGGAVADVLLDESVIEDREKFAVFLRKMIDALFEFLFAHPKYVQILFWEAAAEWKTWNTITYRPDDTTEIVRIVEQARDTGIVRADFDPDMFPAFIMNVTAGTIRFSHRFGEFWPEGETDERKRHMMKQVGDLVVHGLLT